VTGYPRRSDTGRKSREGGSYAGCWTSREAKHASRLYIVRLNRHYADWRGPHHSGHSHAPFPLSTVSAPQTRSEKLEGAPYARSSFFFTPPSIPFSADSYLGLQAFVRLGFPTIPTHTAPAQSLPVASGTPHTVGKTHSHLLHSHLTLSQRSSSEEPRSPYS
jgi:hypothetical protein